MKAQGSWQYLLVGLLSASAVVSAGCSEETDDGSAGGTAGSGAGADDDAGARAVGRMNISEGFQKGNPSAKMNASFMLVAESVCGVEVQTFGQCSITTKTQPTCTPGCSAGKVCAWTADCSAGECVDPVTFHAGDITVTGATHQDPLTCTYNATLVPPKYECDVQQEDVSEPGDELHIVAAGDAFPAFDLTMSAPPEHSFTTDTASWTAATFDGSADVPLEWDTSESADEFKLTVISDADDPDLVCKFPDSGSFIIPKEALAALGSEIVQVDIHRQNKLMVNEGEDGELTILTVFGLQVVLPAGGSCYSCSGALQACQTACPDVSELCAGASADAYAALDECICAECTSECALTCSGAGTDAGCQPCKQTAMSGACSAQRSTCTSS